MHILLVDDDPGLRALLRTTFELVDVDVEEAASAAAAAAAIAERRPEVVVLDIAMPGMDGLSFCRNLKNHPETSDVGVVLLTGSDYGTQAAADEAGADAFLRKPFSPLELVAAVERLADGPRSLPLRVTKDDLPGEQLLLYARDLRHMLEVERSQRRLLQSAYRETVSALASALESKDTGTREHSQRVQLYAVELARTVDPELIDEEPSVEYGFLLHDFGKIGVPDSVLQKPGPLNDSERRLMESHTVLGEQMLDGVAFLQGEGLTIVRSHHERWDGSGYPDGLAGPQIPLGARIFAVADALDAMTSDRPYRRALGWREAGAEILRESGGQFDPRVARAFSEREPELRTIRRHLVAA